MNIQRYSKEIDTALFVECFDAYHHGFHANDMNEGATFELGGESYELSNQPAIRGAMRVLEVCAEAEDEVYLSAMVRIESMLKAMAHGELADLVISGDGNITLPHSVVMACAKAKMDSKGEDIWLSIDDIKRLNTEILAIEASMNVSH